MDTNKNREWTRLRQAFLRRPWFPNYGGQDGAAGYEWTRMNSRKKAQKAQKRLGEECSFRCPGDP
jgi:hypothetical protein